MAGDSTSEYLYEGTGPDGQAIKGIFTGDKEAFLKEARSKNIIILKVRARKVRLKKGKFSERDFHTGIEELYHLISSGMKTDKALGLLIKTSRKESFVAFWKNVLQEVKSGKQLSQAIKAASVNAGLKLPEFYLSIISVGEEVGRTGQALHNLTEHLNFRRGLVSEIKSALAYPAFVIMMSAVTVGLIFGLILPRFSSLFSEKDAEKIPAISRMMFAVGDFISGNFLVILLSLFLLIPLLIPAVRWMRGRIGVLFYRLPFTRDLTLHIEIANVLSSFGMMLNGGIDLSRALRQSARITNLPLLSALLERSVEEVKKGRKISDIWSESELIPADVTSLMVVGENSARLGEISMELGNRYLLRFKEETKRLLSLLEPSIILVLGVFIGIIVLAIMLALVSLTDIIT